MKATGMATRLVAGALLFLVAQLAAADWKYYEAKNYGFSMLIPEGTKMTDRKSVV